MNIDLIHLPCDEDIADKSKSDSVAKCITLLQVLWFAVQLIGRAVERLPTTTLELLIMGFVVCTTVTYISRWHKPKNIGRAMLCGRLTPERLSELGILGTKTHVSLIDIVEDVDVAVWLFVTCLVALAFGACHLIGWEFYFPTDTERILWRVASVLCGVLPLTLLFPDWRGPDRKGWAKILTEVVLRTCTGVYVLVRCYLLVEASISLRSVPEGVYKTVQWASYLPHI